MFKVYKSGLQINPYLLNPIQAVRRTSTIGVLEDLRINHATMWYDINETLQVNLCVTLPDGKSTTMHPNDLEISNESELKRLYEMFEWLGPKYGFNKGVNL